MTSRLSDLALDTVLAKAKEFQDFLSKIGPEAHLQLFMTLPKEDLKAFVRALCYLAETGIDNRESLGDADFSPEMQQAIVAFYDCCDRMVVEIIKLKMN